MPSDNPVSDAAKGVTKGFLDWSSEKIATFVKKLRDRKLLFVQDPKTIEIVKDQYRAGEAKFYQSHIKDKDVLFLVRMGLALRKLEGDEERLRNLRSKILRKYNIEGLHIAEFVQNGILIRYIGILLEDLTSVEEFEKNVMDVLKNIEKYTIFVQVTNKAADVLKTADIKVISNSPKIFIISGLKSTAKLVAENIEQLKIILKDYEFERFSSGEKEILFFKRKRDL